MCQTTPRHSVPHLNEKTPLLTPASSPCPYRKNKEDEIDATEADGTKRKVRWGNAWLVCFYVLVAVAGYVGLLHMGMLCARARYPDPQPISGAFQFASTFSRVRVFSVGAAGDAKLTVSLGTSEHAHVAFAIQAEKGNEAAQKETKVLASLNQGASELNIQILLPPSSNGMLHAEVRVTLPQSLEEFLMHGNHASLHWEGPNVQSNFTVSLNTGSVKIFTPLDVSGPSSSSSARSAVISKGSFAATTAAGSISLLETLNVGAGDVDLLTYSGSIDVVHVRALNLKAHAKIGKVSVQDALIDHGNVDLESNNGNIAGVFSGYSSFILRANTGSAAVSLYPGIGDTQNFLTCYTGAIDAAVYEFKGKYSASTQMGSVQVSGNEVHKINGTAGWVADSDSKGVFDAETRIGNVKDPIISYLLPHETAYIMFKSGKETHLFTDLAYVSIKGVTAGTSRRYLDRIEYTEAPISDVCFETAGYGITDRDVELKFTMGAKRISIDIWKNEIQTALGYYRAILIISHEQAKNRELMALSVDALSRLMPANVVVVEADKELSVGEAVALQAVKAASFLHRQYSPQSYKHVFENLGL
ncbi:hypothetical protein HDU78_000558 [Chytriomyces hyalinus]|nr:hypothetical protein HDU78_000558 [Chytriomyces hyalinus]